MTTNEITIIVADLQGRIDRELTRHNLPAGTMWVEQTEHGLTINDANTGVVLDAHDVDFKELMTRQSTYDDHAPTGPRACRLNPPAAKGSKDEE